MPDMILDGAGKNFRAEVNSKQELAVRATTESEAQSSNKEGMAYNINTKNITLTDAADTPVLYLKNNATNDLIVETIVVGAKPSTGGSSTDLPEVTFVRNPTSGTLISGASLATINSNRNYGSSNTLTADAFEGVTGSTLSGGEDHIFVYASTTGRTALSINEILPTGTSIGIKYKPQASNTSQVIYVAIICHLREDL